MNFNMFLKNLKIQNRLYPFYFQVRHPRRTGLPYVFGKYILYSIHNFLYHALVTNIYSTELIGHIIKNKLFKKNKACHFLKSKRRKPKEYKFISGHNCSQNEMNFRKYALEFIILGRLGWFTYQSTSPASPSVTCQASVMHNGIETVCWKVCSFKMSLLTVEYVLLRVMGNVQVRWWVCFSFLRWNLNTDLKGKFVIKL